MLTFASGCHVSTTIGGCEKQVKNLRIQLFGGPGQIILTFAIKKPPYQIQLSLDIGHGSCDRFQMGSSVDASATETDGDTTETDIDVDADSDTDDYPPLSDSCPFSEGEKVLAYHNLRIYPAKVLFLSFFLFSFSFSF